MKLADLAHNISIPLEDFKEFVEERFNVILLSKYADVPDFVVKSIFEDGETLRELVEFRKRCSRCTDNEIKTVSDGDISDE